jgi:AcrR family transcriptional regulator
MLTSAAWLFMERGVAGTSFRDVVEHSGAPRGSIYHHFPGGKAQLAEEAVAQAGAAVAMGIESAAAESDPVTVLRGFIEGWGLLLAGSDFRTGCPVAAGALAAPAEGEGSARAAAACFDRWEAAFAGSLGRAGIAEERARQLSTFSVAAFEGAIVLARARRSTEPLTVVGQQLEMVIGAELEGEGQ